MLASMLGSRVETEVGNIVGQGQRQRLETAAQVRGRDGGWKQRRGSGAATEVGNSGVSQGWGQRLVTAMGPTWVHT